MRTDTAWQPTAVDCSTNRAERQQAVDCRGPFTFTRDAARPYNIDDGWTLHLRARQDVAALHAAVLRTGCEALTGEAVGGDCWWEWCEVAHPRGDQALHVYLDIPARSSGLRTLTAIRTAVELCQRLGVDPGSDAALSDAADWSRQYLLPGARP